MTLRWEADHVITADQVRGAIREHFPDVDAGTVRHLGSGWEFDAYATNDGWVFRFPRKKDGGAVIDRERRVQELTASRIRSVAVSRITRVAPPGAHFAHPFSGYRLIPGERADRVSGLDTGVLGRQLGTALSELHAIDPDEARAIGVKDDLEGADEWLEEARDHAPALEGFGPDVAAGLTWLDRAVPPPPYAGPLRFVHNDLAPEHLIVDETSSRLVGIIDWTDAAMGDPMLDFLVMLCWRGWPFVETIRSTYALSLDGGFAARLAFVARALSLIWLWEAAQQGGDVEKHVAWVRNAFSE